MTDSGPAGGARWMARGEREIPRTGDWLTPHEAAVAAGMRFTKRRTEYLLRRWVCKQAVAAAAGLPADLASLASIEVRNHPTGAPYVHAAGAPSVLEVALSDRAGWAVCLVGEALGRLGVRPRARGAAVRGFRGRLPDPGRAGLGGVACRRADRDAAANLLWSAKESALKVLQTGLRRDTRSVEVMIGTPGPAPSGTHGTDDWSPLEVRTAEGGVLPGWWRRGGRFLLTVASERPLPPPIEMSGSRALGDAQPEHSWVDRPLAD